MMDFELVRVDNDFCCWTLDLELDFYCSLVAKGALQFQIVQGDVIVGGFDTR